MHPCPNMCVANVMVDKELEPHATFALLLCGQVIESLDHTLSVCQCLHTMLQAICNMWTLYAHLHLPRVDKSRQ